MIATSDNLHYMRLHTAALYTYDPAGRVTGCNQFSGGAVPRFHLARTDQGNFCVLRNDVDSELAQALHTYTQQEPPLTDPRERPVHQQKYIDLLEQVSPVSDIWLGPVFRMDAIKRVGQQQVVPIQASNKQLLHAYMDDWVVDVDHRYPFMAAVAQGHAVAVCASARMTDAAHEAGVESNPAYRRQGHAAAVVAAWAEAVAATGAEPLYSTAWENHASQALANSLGLELVGADFHIR